MWIDTYRYFYYDANKRHTSKMCGPRFVKSPRQNFNSTKMLASDNAIETRKCKIWSYRKQERKIYMRIVYTQLL